MSRRIGIAVRVQMRAVGQPSAFTWRGETFRVRVLSRWWLATRWWDYEREADRTYYRVETADHQIFERYRDAARCTAWRWLHVPRYRDAGQPQLRRQLGCR
jgi:hypothetical protein